MNIRKITLKKCGTCPEEYLINQKVKLCKSDSSYEISVDSDLIERFELNATGYKRALICWADTLESEAAIAQRLLLEDPPQDYYKV
jgi:hypothetical protein